ncbi:MAG: DUF1003 domain-containing protein [Beijerinckiaceae bacterium]|jgi:uncharacterized membrane protein|nr:DUF1003 domain-containing protein [Beijerinckiaceae bacterium]
MNVAADLTHRLHEQEIKLLDQLRAARRRRTEKPHPELPIGDRISDWVAATMGSWRFIIIQSVLLLIWIILNVTAYVQQWDPYPFILLNLALSFQAAYAAPFIMMSQNRQSAIDRQAAQHDYTINAKAELEIELLHQKLDLLRETEVAELIHIIRRLEEHIPAGLVIASAALSDNEDK